MPLAIRIEDETLAVALAQELLGIAQDVDLKQTEEGWEVRLDAGTSLTPVLDVARRVLQGRPDAIARVTIGGRSFDLRGEAD